MMPTTLTAVAAPDPDGPTVADLYAMIEQLTLAREAMAAAERIVHAQVRQLAQWALDVLDEAVTDDGR